jgi:hypothetical protein
MKSVMDQCQYVFMLALLTRAYLWWTQQTPTHACMKFAT